jgi:hypothetical protein
LYPPRGVYFLTEIDPRAAVKGSRDPLGLQPIWTRFGRQVVGNLTTVTTSLRNFTTWMLGLHFAEELIAPTNPLPPVTTLSIAGILLRNS